MTEESRAEPPPRDEHGQLLCSYCGGRAHFHQTSTHIYGRDYGPVWHCPRCAAWVGCHPGRGKPLGRLAKADLRKAKQEAHKAFDRLWRSSRDRGARSKAYTWLAEQLGIDKSVCHIGMFNEAMCRRVIEACRGRFVLPSQSQSEFTD